MSQTSNNWAQTAEAQVLDAALGLVEAHGWSSQTLQRAAAQAGLSPGDAALLLPGGPRDLAALYARRLDQAMLDALAPLDPAAMKVRERIVRGVQARQDAAAEHEAATRRWAGFLALPFNLPLAVRLQWASADAIWRWAGDTATDENHYSKRAILSAILGSALLVRLSAGKAEADAYVQRRVDDVMSFEKWKAGLPQGDLAAQAAGVLGRVRYGG
jgi:ubiquinone biosynthesis protein COQ9